MSTATKWQPFSNPDMVAHEITKYFGGFGRLFRCPSFDVSEGERERTIRFNLHGVRHGTLKLEYLSGVLILRGQLQVHGESVAFEQALALPRDVRPEDVKATLTPDVLVVTVPCGPEQPRHVIPITATTK